jgi:hypothetical protein
MPNLRKDLGRNEPQFRTAWGLIRARRRRPEACRRLENDVIRWREHVTGQHVAPVE